MKQIAGKATIYIDGQKKFVGDSYSYTTSNTSRTDSVGKSGVAGFIATPTPSKISVQLVDTPDAPIDGVDQITDATIVLDLNDGSRQYTFFNCAYIGEPFETDQDGRGTAEFHSPVPPKRTK